jgi:hypothetical protein
VNVLGEGVHERRPMRSLPTRPESGLVTPIRERRTGLISIPGDPARSPIIGIALVIEMISGAPWTPRSERSCRRRRRCRKTAGKKQAANIHRVTHRSLPPALFLTGPRYERAIFMFICREMQGAADSRVAFSLFCMITYSAAAVRSPGRRAKKPLLVPGLKSP